MDFIPEAQALLILVAETVFGMPLLIDAYFAGSWPSPEESAFPNITSSIIEGWTFIDFIAALIAVAARSVAFRREYLLINTVIGVRLAATIKTLFMDIN